MVYARVDEDNAYRRFADDLGRAWSPKGSLIAAALLKKAAETEAVRLSAPIEIPTIEDLTELKGDSLPTPALHMFLGSTRRRLVEGW